MTSEYASYLGEDLPLEEAVKEYREGTVNSLTVMAAMHKADVPQCVIDLFSEQHCKVVGYVRKEKEAERAERAFSLYSTRKSLTKEDVLSWVRRATFKETTDYCGQFHDGFRQVFSMHDDNPFRSDYGDDGGYKLETIHIEYGYEPAKDEVSVSLVLSLDMCDVPGCRDAEFEQECLAILFEKEPRLDNRKVSGHVKQVRREKLKRVIQEEVKNLRLPNDDIALAFEEVLYPER